MTDKTKPALYALTPEQHATVLIALGYFEGMCASLEQRGTPDTRTVTYAHGEVRPLDYKGTGELINALNHTGLEFTHVVPLFAESAADCAYVRTAQEQAKEGEFEIDEPAVVSRGDDAGAYVMGWMWVSDADAGLEKYWTVQLDDKIPDGGVVIGGTLPESFTWYFEDELDQTLAIEFAKNLGYTCTTGKATELPDGQDEPDDIDTFKTYVTDCAAGREPQ